MSARLPKAAWNRGVRHRVEEHPPGYLTASVQSDVRAVGHADPDMDVRSTPVVPDQGGSLQTPVVPHAIVAHVAGLVEGNLAGIEPEKATMEIIGKRVKMGHEVFPGDKYSAGDAARPLFSIID